MRGWSCLLLLFFGSEPARDGGLTADQSLADYPKPALPPPLPTSFSETSDIEPWCLGCCTPASAFQRS
jgi:hypothetical protein